MVKDGGEQVWREVLRMPWEDYVDSVVKIAKRNPAGEYDRNYVLRPWFNTVVRPDGREILPRGLDNFYSNPDGLYCRVMAYETGRDDIIQNLLKKSEFWLGLPEYKCIVSHLLAVEDEAPRVLDHGCGLCHTSLGLLKKRIDVTMYDYDIPSRRAVIKSVGLYGHNYGMYPEQLRFIHAGVHGVDEAGSFHAVISQDVLEHLPHPDIEVKKFNRMLRPGGLLLMGTFFNSCNGQDPQHLFENDKYQDTDLWFNVVAEAGFEPYLKDVNGVLKVWRKK